MRRLRAWSGCVLRSITCQCQWIGMAQALTALTMQSKSVAAKSKMTSTTSCTWLRCTGVYRLMMTTTTTMIMIPGTVPTTGQLKMQNRIIHYLPVRAQVKELNTLYQPCCLHGTASPCLVSNSNFRLEFFKQLWLSRYNCAKTRNIKFPHRPAVVYTSRNRESLFHQQHKIE